MTAITIMNMASFLQDNHNQLHRRSRKKLSLLSFVVGAPMAASLSLQRQLLIIPGHVFLVSTQKALPAHRTKIVRLEMELIFYAGRTHPSVFVLKCFDVELLPLCQNSVTV